MTPPASPPHNGAGVTWSEDVQAIESELAPSGSADLSRRPNSTSLPPSQSLAAPPRTPHMAQSPKSPASPAPEKKPRVRFVKAAAAGKGHNRRGPGSPARNDADTQLSANRKSFGFRKTNAALARSRAESREALEAAKRAEELPNRLGKSSSPSVSLQKKHVFMLHRHPQQIADDSMKCHVRKSYFFKKFTQACRRQKQGEEEFRRAQIESDLITRPTLLINLVPIIARILEACFEACWVRFTCDLHTGGGSARAATMEYRVTAVELMGLVNHHNSVCIPMEDQTDYEVLAAMTSAANVVARAVSQCPHLVPLPKPLLILRHKTDHISCRGAATLFSLAAQ